MAAVYQLKFRRKRPVSFPLEDKHVVNEHHFNSRKSHAATQKNVLTWRISMYHVIGLKQTYGIKSIAVKAAKYFVGVVVYCMGIVIELTRITYKDVLRFLQR